MAPRSVQPLPLTALMGRDVFDRDGRRVGAVSNVFVDPLRFSFVALGVGGGLFPREHRFGKGLLRSLGDRIVLDAVPKDEYLGKPVVKDGRRVGRVRDALAHPASGRLLGLLVETGRGTIGVAGSEIGFIDEEILLKGEV